MNPASPEDSTPVETTAAEAANAHLDPLTGEPGAHPVGVGIGAAGAGVAGAVIGAVVGPVGMLVGAAIGAVAGAFAGKEVAAADDTPLKGGEGADPLEETAGLATAPGAGMSGLFSGGVPAANLPTASGAHSLDAGTESAPSEEEAGSTFGGGGEPFHDAFTATTFRETVEENQLTGDDSTDGSDLTESIRTTAYFRYLDRLASGGAGNEYEDWLRAEQEVLRG